MKSVSGALATILVLLASTTNAADEQNVPTMTSEYLDASGKPHWTAVPVIPSGSTCPDFAESNDTLVPGFIPLVSKCGDKGYTPWQNAAVDEGSDTGATPYRVEFLDKSYALLQGHPGGWDAFNVTGHKTTQKFNSIQRLQCYRPLKKNESIAFFDSPPWGCYEWDGKDYKGFVKRVDYQDFLPDKAHNDNHCIDVTASCAKLVNVDDPDLNKASPRSNKRAAGADEPFTITTMVTTW